MKIAYLIPECGITGGVAVACQHTNRLLARGHDVYLVTQTSEANINWFPQQKVKVLTIDDYPENVDILVATGWSTSFIAVELPAKRKFYFVQSDETRFHESNSVWQKLTALSYLLNFHYFTEAQWIQGWLKKNFDHDSTLIPNGLDQNIFFPDEPLAPKGDKPRILLEGAIDLPYKGMQDAFEAVEGLDAEIWCVSSLGKPKPEWHCDRFFSRVSMEKMRRIYSSCDILLKMSRVEGFFGPPLEMMACGGAVVVGKVTGYDEYIKDEYNALVVEQGDVDGARKAIQRLISDNDLKSALIANGKKTVEEWNWDSSIDKLEKYFYNVLNNKNGFDELTARKLSDEAIALSFEMAKNLSINYNQFEPSAFTEPIDRLFYRLRKSKFLNFIATIIYKVYKFIKK
jgi:glycosyltransferase involved in cell wall biosynthesis